MRTTKHDGRTSKTSFITPLLCEAALICCFSIVETAWSSNVNATIPYIQNPICVKYKDGSLEPFKF